jgi:hypothetical protein
MEVVAVGLDNPRGLTFGPDGALYVAEAGSGGDDVCSEGPEGEVCYGYSGAVTRVLNGVQERVAMELISSADGGNFATGPHDVAVTANGHPYTLTGLGGDPAVRAPDGPLGDLGMDLGQLVHITLATGDWSNEVDVAGYEGEANPDGGAVDSNPYNFVAIADGFVVADAGGNSLLKVDMTGETTISTLAVFPDRMVEFPPGSGSQMPMQAVPTTVAIGPDGAYYVGQLTGFPFPVGGANVYRVDPAGGDPEIYAEGFTNIVGIDFDANGNLYVVELATNGLRSNDLTGRVVQVTPEGRQKTIASAGLVAPGGVAVGPDGYVYISNFSVFAGAGQVVRLNPQPMVQRSRRYEVGMDSFIDATQPNVAFGAASTMWSGYADNMRPVVQADIPVCADKHTCITPNATVDTAYLYVYVVEGRGFPAWVDSVIDVSAHALQAPWDDTTTWNSPWTNPGGDFGPALDTIKVGSGRIDTWWRFDVTDAVADIVAGLAENNGFALTSQYNVPPKEMAALASARYGLAAQSYWDPSKSAYLRVMYRTFD